jgi:sugar phosphate isomerase/epimerase
MHQRRSKQTRRADQKEKDETRRLQRDPARPVPARGLKVIADLGLTGIEINTGGFLPPVHMPSIDEILNSDAARDEYLSVFEGTGVSIAGLNCNGNPLHPNPEIGEKHAEDIRLAHRLGQNRVVTMSGLPGGEHGATVPNWIVNAWNSAALDVLDYQWEIAAEFWKEIDQLARELDVKVALELHPQNLVFNTADVRKLIHLAGATHIGVELDASHLFWQHMDPVAVVRELGPLVFQAAAKDVRINKENAALYGVLDNSFRRLSPDEDRTSLGGNEWVNEWPKTPPGTSSPWAATTTPPTGPNSCAPSMKWTRTCWSTSNTKTSPSAVSKASKRPQKSSATPTPPCLSRRGASAHSFAGT